MISAVFAGGRCWLRERQKYETSVPSERHRQRGSGSQRPKEVIWWVYSQDSEVKTEGWSFKVVSGCEM